MATEDCLGPVTAEVEDGNVESVQLETLERGKPVLGLVPPRCPF